MASSETQTLTIPPPNPPALILQTDRQQDYKDLSPVKYNFDTELNGGNGYSPAKYPNYLPTWDKSQKYPPLEPFEHRDRGHDGDASFRDLFPSTSSIQVTHMTPLMGTEVRGIQLSSLTDAGKDQLARFVAERRVVAFRDQDFASLPVKDAIQYAAYFGPLHIHPTSGAPPGHPEVHLVHRPAGGGDDTGATKAGGGGYFASRTSSVFWHSDVSYELQPAGTTLMYILETPETGGDTIFANTVEAYNRLSPLFQERLHGLEAVHSGVEQVNVAARKGGIKRREPVTSIHPIVRTHPVTGEKALYVNPQFTREIVGLKKEESDALLKFLFEHIAYGIDFHVRTMWEEGTVVVWDNRVTQHTALVDWSSGSRRHLARITPQAERPYETPFEKP